MAATAAKLIYTFPEGNAGMRALLGGKGAGLAEMTNAGPAGARPASRSRPRPATPTTPPASSCPPGLWDDVLAHMTALEAETGKRFGDPANPLLVSVRSGAAFSHARDDGHRPEPRA